MSNQHNEYLANRAKLKDEGKMPDCQKCDEPLVFALQDGEHQFSIGISTILKCLKFAEQEHAIPPIPYEWWSEVKGRINLY